MILQSKPSLKLTDATTREAAIERLETYVPLEVSGYDCTTDLGFKIRRLYFDKGFCTIPVLRYVQQRGWPAILACPIRGKDRGDASPVSGSGQLSDRPYLPEQRLWHLYGPGDRGPYLHLTQTR
jgi:hypothetical protein